jgi:hypothetical protein
MVNDTWNIANATKILCEQLFRLEKMRRVWFMVNDTWNILLKYGVNIVNAAKILCEQLFSLEKGVYVCSCHLAKVLV